MTAITGYVLMRILTILEEIAPYLKNNYQSLLKYVVLTFVNKEAYILTKSWTEVQFAHTHHVSMTQVTQYRFLKTRNPYRQITRAT